MPPLETKTFRLRADQRAKVDVEHKDRSSYLMRRLLDIFWTSAAPGTDIMILRNNMKLPEESFKALGKK